MPVSTDYETVRRRLVETAEAKHLLDEAKRFPFGGLYNIAASVKRAKMGSVLEVEELQDIRTSAECFAALKVFFSQAATSIRTWRPTDGNSRNSRKSCARWRRPSPKRGNPRHGVGQAERPPRRHPVRQEPGQDAVGAYSARSEQPKYFRTPWSPCAATGMSFPSSRSTASISPAWYTTNQARGRRCLSNPWPWSTSTTKSSGTWSRKGRSGADPAPSVCLGRE